MSRILSFLFLKKTTKLEVPKSPFIYCLHWQRTFCFNEFLFVRHSCEFAGGFRGRCLGAPSWSLGFAPILFLDFELPRLLGFLDLACPVAARFPRGREAPRVARKPPSSIPSRLLDMEGLVSLTS